MSRKLATFLRLLFNGQWSMLRRQWFVNIAKWRVHRAGGRAFVNEDLGFRSVCHPDWPDSMGQFLACDGDMWEFSVMKRWLREGDIAIDVGANIGLYTCLALARTGSRGRVIAIDADPFVIEKLKVTASLVGGAHLTLIHAAVANEDGELIFFINQTRAHTGEQSLRPTDEQRKLSEPMTVPAIRLRTVAARHFSGAAPSLVKIDIEGAEDGALASAPTEWLTANGPLWIIEINRHALANFEMKPADILRHFAADAFSLWLQPKHPVPEFPSAALRLLQPDERFSDAVYYNLIAVPRGSRWRQRLPDLTPCLPVGSAIEPVALA